MNANFTLFHQKQLRNKLGMEFNNIFSSPFMREKKKFLGLWNAKSMNYFPILLLLLRAEIIKIIIFQIKNFDPKGHRMSQKVTPCFFPAQFEKA